MSGLRNGAFRIILGISLMSTASAAIAGGPKPSPDLSPARWPAAEYDLNARRTFSAEALTAADRQPAVAAGTKGMVVGTSEALAIHAGVKTLEAGGSAMDAAITTSLAQITLNTGAIISFGGFTTLVYYEKKTGRTYTMNAGFNTVRGEKDPLSIPPTERSAPAEVLINDYPYSGRAVLVPGFMAGMEAAHQRFGKLPFGSLFTPSIYWAENGFPVGVILSSMMQGRQKVLMERADTRAIFTGADGKLLAPGQTLRQPALAETLKGVARGGARYMYQGPWAKRFVETVRADGGQITLADMKRYKPVWEEPTRVPFNGYEVVTMGRSSAGGTSIAGAFNLLSAADLAAKGPYGASAETLADMMKIAHYSGAAAKVTSLPADRVKAIYGNFDVTKGALLDPAAAKSAWAAISGDSTGATAGLPSPKTPGHSAAVVAVDAEGNVAALVHTINTSVWGGSAVFVGGVSVSDAGWHQKWGVAAAGPGKRLPEPTAPVIVFKDGKPVFATSTIGGGLHEKTTQALYRMLAEGAPIEQAIASPMFYRPRNEMQGSGAAQQLVSKGEFDAAVLDGVRARGIPVNEIDLYASGLARGYMVGVALDPATGAMKGAYDMFIPTGMAEGR